MSVYHVNHVQQHACEHDIYKLGPAGTMGRAAAVRINNISHSLRTQLQNTPDYDTTGMKPEQWHTALYFTPG
jgi:hypothetical protein